MTKTFTSAQINTLRSECSKLDRIDPSSPTYKALIVSLNGMSTAQLRQIRDGQIKFLSRLAANRVPV